MNIPLLVDIIKIQLISQIQLRSQPIIICLPHAISRVYQKYYYSMMLFPEIIQLFGNLFGISERPRKPDLF